MKYYYLKILTIVFLTAACATAYSQTGQVAFELEKMYVLYRGLDNPIKIVGNSKIDSITIFSGKSYQYNYDDYGVIKDSSLVEIKSNIIKVEESNSYIIQPGNTNFCELRVFSNGQVIDSRSYRVKSVPWPIVMIGTKRDGETVKISEIASISSIRCVLENFDFDVTWEITEFEVSKMTKGKWSTRYESGSAISSDLKAWLMDAKPNDVIYFEIKVNGSDGSTRAFPDVILKVSE